MSADVLPSLPPSAVLLPALLDLSISGVVYYLPVHDEAGQVIDLAFGYLNPAARRMLHLPAQPATTYLQQFPTSVAAGIWDFHRDAWLANEPRQLTQEYRADGYDNYYLIAAQRVGEGLLVSFSDTSEHGHTPVGQALRESRTRQHAAQAEAERQRGELRRVFEQAPVAIAVLRGPAYEIELANPTMCGLWSRRAEEVAGQKLFEVLPEATDMGYKELLTSVMAAGAPHVAHAMQTQHEHNGHLQTLYWDFVYEPLYAENGRPDGVLVVASEVTEQVAARRQLEHLNQELEARVQERTSALTTQQHLLSQILGQVPAAIATLSGPEHRYTFFNDDYQAMMAGRVRLGLPLAEAVPEAVEQGFVALLDQVYATQETYVRREVPAQLLDAATGRLLQRYVDLSYQALLDEQGQSTGVLAFVVDVTEGVLARQQAEAMQAALLAAAQHQVQQREELYQVFEQAPAAIMLLREPNHRVEYVNPAYARLFPGVELRGRLLAEAHPRAAADGIIAHFDQVYETGETYVGEEQPILLVPVPGQPPVTRYFNYTYQPYCEQGRPVGVSVFAYDVTEPVLARYAATEQLKRQQGELQRIFEQAPVAIAVMRGTQLLIEQANAAMSRFWGRPASQTLGRPHFEALPETGGQGFEELLQHVLHTGQAVNVLEAPVQLDRTGGQLEQAYGNFTFQPLADEQGTTTGVIAVGIEVTDQVLARQQVEHLNQELEARVQERTQELRAAQAAAERERALLHALFAQAPVAIALFQGEEVRIASANAQMATLWGRPPEQVVGLPLLEAMPELQGQGFDDMIRAVQTTRVPYVGTEEPATMMRDGVLVMRYYNFSCQPIYDAQGELLGVINVGTEVTEQVENRRRIEQLNEELEARVQKRTRQLQEQQVLLRQILGQVPACIATLGGPNHRFTFFNEPYRELSAGGSELGLTVAQVFPNAAEQGFLDLLDQVYTTGKPYEASEMPASIYNARTGQYRQHYLDFVYQPLFDEQQRVQGILAFILDVTDRARARQQAEESQLQVYALNEELAAINEELLTINEELQASNYQLKRTNNDLDTFVYTASHDLKAPITNIEGLLSALRDYLPAQASADDQMVPRLLDMMESSVGRFLTTIGHLTDISRLQHATTEPAEAVPLARLVEDVRLDLAPLLEASRGRLLLTIDECPTVYFSPKNLRSILYNLLSNALKYRAPERDPVVRLRAHCAAGNVVLEVQDNGLGLSAAQQTRLFALFQRLHTHVEGSGVGLYMLKRIVENAGGTITVRSGADVGSTFTVTLPGAVG